ncbi:Phytoene desaturase [hydrothermal vent metagenome]|uniref:Phytoene desaturase n=1 Tax=hydrothermal vent metagenome TaxID=652676 RepID=A0A3B1A644_9ZZZZ
MTKTAVIGAGPMGLACAYQLLKDGYDVDIYEADDRIGGMSAHFDFNGLSIERFYHFICKEDFALFELLDELNLTNQLVWRNTLMGYFFQGELYKWGNPIALLTFPKLSLINRFRYGLHMFLSSRMKNGDKIDSEDAVTWIKRWQGNATYNTMWSKLFELKFYHFTSNLSASWIWARIRRVGRSRKNLMQEQMGYLNGGSNTLLSAIQKAIEGKGGKIFLNAKIESVECNNNIVSGLTANGQKLKYDNVITTIPLPFIPKLIPELPKGVLNSYSKLNNIGVVCLIFKLKQKVSNNFWLNINSEGIKIPGIIEYSNLYPNPGQQDSPEHIVYIPFYMPQDNLKYKNTDEQFIAESKQYLFLINKALTNDDIIDVTVSRYSFAQPICEPSFKNTLPPIKSVITGLFIADTSHYYPEDRSITESVALGREIASLL